MTAEVSRSAMQTFDPRVHAASVLSENNIVPALRQFYVPAGVAGDGHCKFHAYSISVFGHPNRHYWFRLICCFAILDHWDLIGPIIRNILDREMLQCDSAKLTQSL